MTATAAVGLQTVCQPWRMVYDSYSGTSDWCMTATAVVGLQTVCQPWRLVVTAGSADL